jgi:hypothetical protein
MKCNIVMFELHVSASDITAIACKPQCLHSTRQRIGNIYSISLCQKIFRSLADHFKERNKLLLCSVSDASGGDWSSECFCSISLLYDLCAGKKKTKKKNHTESEIDEISFQQCLQFFRVSVCYDKKCVLFRSFAIN